MRNKDSKEIGEVLGYATGLLVGDMCLRDLPEPRHEQEVEAYRARWANTLRRDDTDAAGGAAFNRGFDRAIEPPLPKGKVGRHVSDNAFAVAKKVGEQASIVARMLQVLSSMEPHMQLEVIEACSRLMSDLDERLANVAGLPNLPK